MEENPYRAPPAAAETVAANGTHRTSHRRVASLSAGFCLALATVFGMVAAVSLLALVSSERTWLSWAPVIAVGSVANTITSTATAWSIWKARWWTAVAAFALGATIFVLLAMGWYKIFGE
jgi:hypothetical protein